MALNRLPASRRRAALPGDQPKRTFDDADLAVSFVDERGGRVESRKRAVDNAASRHRLWLLRDDPIDHLT